MSEEFALEELVRDGWATNFEEVLCTAGAQIMQQSCSQLFARATLTRDENWNFGQSGFLQLGANPMDCRRVTKKYLGRSTLNCEHKSSADNALHVNDQTRE